MNMQINLKSFLLKNETFYAEFFPFPISTRVEQRTIPIWSRRESVREYANEFKVFTCKKNHVFSAEFRLSPFPTHAKQRYDHDRGENAEFCLQEYANESKVLSVKKSNLFAKFRTSPI